MDNSHLHESLDRETFVEIYSFLLTHDFISSKTKITEQSGSARLVFVPHQTEKQAAIEDNHHLFGHYLGYFSST